MPLRFVQLWERNNVCGREKTWLHLVQQTFILLLRFVQKGFMPVTSRNTFGPLRFVQLRERNYVCGREETWLHLVQQTLTLLLRFV